MSQEYYQLGGFHPQIQWFQSTYDDKSLAEAIVSSLRSKSNLGRPLELVLGIKSCGSSHLLLTDEQTRQVSLEMRLPLPRSRPLTVRAFESLSPIEFTGVEDLSKKLSFLKPKAKKGAANPNQPDSSQANRGYNIHEDNLYRGTFEHGRVIYRVLNDSSSSRTYGLEDVSWAHNVRISAFVFNTKGVDDRPRADRTRYPTVLDIGFCDALLPTLAPNYNSSKHVIHTGNSLLGRKEPKKPFSYGISEQVSREDMPTRIQLFFKEYHRERDAPMILIVYKEEETMNFLHNMGVDVSRWRYGLRDLLIPERQASSPSRQDARRYSNDLRSNGALPYNDYESDRERPRYRSRSPQRYSSSSSSHRGQYQDSRQAAARRDSYPPVYVVDVHRLYETLMQTQDTRTIVDIGRRFKLTDVVGWCAGNEAGLLIDIWKSMVAGPPIDDQREMRSAGRSDVKSEQEVESLPVVDNGPRPSIDSDEEEDPNDYVPKPEAQTLVEAPAAQDGYDFDVSDYGSDSD